MKYEEIKTAYPKSCIALMEFSKKYIKVFQDAIDPDEANELDEILDNEIMEEAIEFMVQVQQRALYDFFDENEVYCCPIFSPSGFMYDVTTKLGEKGDVTAGGYYDKRMTAENAMFLEAFKKLEDKL